MGNYILENIGEYFYLDTILQHNCDLKINRM